MKLTVILKSTVSIHLDKLKLYKKKYFEKFNIMLRLVKKFFKAV